MRERPILFRGPMVRAILAGTKTQTRRIVKWRDLAPGLNLGFTGLQVYSYAPGLYTLESRSRYGWGWESRSGPTRCPYGDAGDRLWVRETFVQGYDYDGAQDRYLQYDDNGNELPMKTWYRATEKEMRWVDDDGWETNVPWRPSIHMPRTACRLVLEITSVRVERLSAISETDAQAEGCDPWEDLAGVQDVTVRERLHGYKRAYQHLWGQLHGADSWRANPWVWVIEFRVLASANDETGGGNGHAA